MIRLRTGVYLNIQSAELLLVNNFSAQIRGKTVLFRDFDEGYLIALASILDSEGFEYLGGLYE